MRTVIIVAAAVLAMSAHPTMAQSDPQLVNMSVFAYCYNEINEAPPVGKYGVFTPVFPLVVKRFNNVTPQDYFGGPQGGNVHDEASPNGEFTRVILDTGVSDAGSQWCNAFLTREAAQSVRAQGEAILRANDERVIEVQWMPTLK